MISATTPEGRGRVTVDVYALKKSTSLMNLEKYLPDSSRIGQTSYMRFYLSRITGSNSVESLKAIPDLLNKIMGNWVEVNKAELKHRASTCRFSIGQIVNDLVRKKKLKKRIDGKVVEVLQNIHAARLSESPFILSPGELVHAKGQEEPWDKLKSFNDMYARGIPCNEIEGARQRYNDLYQAQMKIAQSWGAFKARRMEALKELASQSLNKKEMDDFKLTKKTKEIALDNFVEIIKSYDPVKNEIDRDLDKIIVNMRPTHLSGYVSEIWNSINKENLLIVYGMKKGSNRKVKYLTDKADEIHNELVLYFPSMATISPFFIGAKNSDEDEEQDEE
jgi:hypothetical protein